MTTRIQNCFAGVVTRRSQEKRSDCSTCIDDHAIVIIDDVQELSVVDNNLLIDACRLTRIFMFLIFALMEMADRGDEETASESPG